MGSSEQLSSSDRRLYTLLEPRQQAGYRYAGLKREHRGEIEGVLAEWGVRDEVGALELYEAGVPVLHAQEMASWATAVPDWSGSLDQTAYDWARVQRARGWGVFVRGNPLPPMRPTLELYATPYYDVGLGAARPGWVLYEPKGGWRHSGEISTASTVELAVRRTEVQIAAAVLGVAALGGVIWLVLKARD